MTSTLSVISLESQRLRIGNYTMWFVDHKLGFSDGIKTFYLSMDPDTTLVEFKGPKGDKGEQGEQGPPGIDGLPGTDGKTGLSAFEFWQCQKYGHVKFWDKDFIHGSIHGIHTEEEMIQYQATLAEYYNAIRGPKGDKGEDGEDGEDGDGGNFFWDVVDSGLTAGALVKLFKDVEELKKYQEVINIEKFSELFSEVDQSTNIWGLRIRMTEAERNINNHGDRLSTLRSDVDSTRQIASKANGRSEANSNKIDDLNRALNEISQREVAMAEEEMQATIALNKDFQVFQEQLTEANKLYEERIEELNRKLEAGEIDETERDLGEEHASNEYDVNMKNAYETIRKQALNLTNETGIYPPAVVQIGMVLTSVWC